MLFKDQPWLRSDGAHAALNAQEIERESLPADGQIKRRRPKPTSKRALQLNTPAN
jgi:hypothetical protein